MHSLHSLPKCSTSRASRRAARSSATSTGSSSRLLQSLSERAPGQTEPDAYAPELGFRATGLRGSNISGDYGASFRVGEWYYLLLCDGMGSGEEARDEAMGTSALLKELIESGLEAHDAMQTINGLYILRDGGGFSAIDLLQVSLVSAEGFLHKWGAAPSFLKFGRTLQTLGLPLPPPGARRRAGAHAPRGIR